MAEDNIDVVDNEDRGDDLITDNSAAETAAAEAAALAVKDAALEKDIIGDKGKEKTADEPAAKDAVDTPAKEEDEQQRDEAGKFVAKDSPKPIPKARVDQMVEKEKLRADAAERRFEELQKTIKTVDRSAEIATLEAENEKLDIAYAKATLDGKTEEMAKIASTIRLNERTIQAAGAQAMSTGAVDQIREEMRLDFAIESVQKQYPALVESHPDYDQDVVDMILSLQETIMRRDRAPAALALSQAADKVMGKFSPQGEVAEVAVETGLKQAKKDDKGPDRKEAAVAKNIDAASKQPANTKDSGMDSDKAGITSDVDAAKLSTEEFDALPESTKARIRGDEL